MMSPKRPVLKLILLLIALAVSAQIVLSFILPRLIDLNSYQTELIKLLKTELHRPVTLGESSFSWRFGPVFTFNDLTISEPEGTELFLTARQVSFRLSILPLFRKRLSLNEIDIQNPVIRISRRSDGKLSIDDLLKPVPATGQAPSALRLHGLKIHTGTLIWHDAAVDTAKELSFTLSGLDLAIDRLTPGKRSTFKLAATLTKGAAGTISSAGSVRLPKEGDGFSTAVVNASLKLSRLEYWHFWPYFGHLLPFPAPGGSTSLDLQLKGAWENLTARGDIRLHQPKLLWPAVFHYPVAPEQAQLVFELKRTPDMLDLPKLNLSLDGFSFRSSLKLTDLQSKDPLIKAQGATDIFDYTRTRTYIPFGIIEDNVADYIKNRIKAGQFKLNSGTLDARLSQLKNFGKGNNAATLYINGTAKDAVISYGPQVPSFNRISTTLELKGRNFTLPDAKAYFGDSPFTLNGAITEYATEGVPCSYPFTMDITPKPSEVAWLARFVQLDKLAFGGNSTLRLTGAGPIDAYHLSGAWQLEQAWYELPQAIRKPAGMANSLSFSAILSNQETKLTALSYALPPMQLSASALFRHANAEPHLSFELQSNSFTFGPKLPVLPQWQQYQPQGMVQLHLFGSGNPEDFSAMQYNGTVRLSNASFRPLENLEPVRAVNGIITFKGSSVQTSRIAVQYGSTPLTMRGRIVNLARPEAELFISSPKLNLKDFGLAGSDVPLLGQFSTHLTFSDQTLHIRALTAHLDKSVINATGIYKNEPAPLLLLNIAAPRLDIEELLPLLAPTQSDRPSDGKQAPPLQLAGRITAENGSYRSITFSKLAANFQNEGGVLQLHSLETAVFDGKLTASGQLVRRQNQPTDWSLNLQLQKARSENLFTALDLNREIRGRLNLSGSLKAKGETVAEVKQTIYGELNLEIERGVLRRFNSLSKVFSILNLSQLLTFRLPDMATNGMPFNRISANVSLKNGILTTRNFFIKSNAMHVSMVGSLNIVKEDMDLLIGVQPLQTVDKVISHIPVVGWIMTGGDSNLISAYFEAKGSWADPKVKAIPVKSMTQGTLGIFQRIFELPVRLFTDTGEVLLGNSSKEGETPQSGDTGSGAPGSNKTTP